MRAQLCMGARFACVGMIAVSLPARMVFILLLAHLLECLCARMCRYRGARVGLIGLELVDCLAEAEMHVDWMTKANSHAENLAKFSNLRSLLDSVGPLVACRLPLALYSYMM